MDYKLVLASNSPRRKELLAGLGVQAGEKKELHILSANDMHAAIECMPRVGFVADSLRALYPNLLVLSAGRRVELIKCFKRAASELKVTGKVIAVDCSDTAPALYFADKYRLVPRIDSGRYVDAVIDVCNEESVCATASVKGMTSRSAD